METQPTNFNIILGTMSGAFLGYTIGIYQLYKKLETVKIVGRTIKINIGRALFINIPIITGAYGYIGYRFNSKPTIDNLLSGIALATFIASMNKCYTHYVIDRSEKEVMPEN